MYRIDLGGGLVPKEGHINIDLIPEADMVIDLEAVGRGEIPLPFENDTVDEVFSAHCFEHVSPYIGVLHEIVRVARLGARVEIRVPHWNQSLANCEGHKHTISDLQVRHWVKDFPDVWWKGCEKRLELVREQWMPSEHYRKARLLFFWIPRNCVMRFLADTCHEIRFVFCVVGNRS